ncbi:MAG: hypothetical protein QOG04_222 [Actinomycetota bacterium]|nr:hypothetical protein [Actinomycetota bacterium]
MKSEPAGSIGVDVQTTPPIAPMAAEHKPRWFARPMDFDRWQADIKNMAKLLPGFDTPTSTALGAAIAFALAWVGENRAEAPDTLQLNFYGLAAIFSLLATTFFWLRNKDDRKRLINEAERICKDIDQCVEEWKDEGTDSN